MITIQGNGIAKIISVNKKLGVETTRFQVLVCYDLLEGLIDEEEYLNFKIELELFSIGTIIISNEKNSLLSVEMPEIRISEESKPERRTSNQIVTKVVPSTIKLKDFYVKPEISLEEKVYPETYYHHTQDVIEVDETLAKIQVQNL